MHPIVLVLMLGAFTQAAPNADIPAPDVHDVTGCVVREPTSGSYMRSDVRNGTFRLAGADVEPFVGRRVRLTGESHRVAVGLGLYPSANVAARAGTDSLALTFAAITSGAMHDAPPATLDAQKRPALEFLVRKVRTLEGRCPQGDSHDSH